MVDLKEQLAMNAIEKEKIKEKLAEEIVETKQKSVNIKS